MLKLKDTLKNIFRSRSGNRGNYSQIDKDDFFFADTCLREAQGSYEEIRSQQIDFDRLIDYDSVYSAEELRTRNLEERLPILQENSYEEIIVDSTAASVKIEDISPYSLVGVAPSESQNNDVSQIIFDLVTDRFKDRVYIVENTYDSIHEETSVHSFSELEDCNKTVQNLIKELNLQRAIIVQSTKALNASRRYHFLGKLEEMEARRVLLIAEIKRDAIIEKISTINGCGVGHGLVKLSHFRFSKKTMSSNLARVYVKRKTETRLWFMLLVSSGCKVLATKILEEEEDVVFEDEFAFESLELDFEISLYLYCVRLKKVIKKNVENPWVLAGRYVLDKDNLKMGNFKLDDVLITCPLSGSFQVDVRSDVLLNETYSGFLDIKTHWKGGNVWGRCWCIMNGASMTFYKYPGDAEFFYSIDLRMSLKNKIGKPDREICARKRCLMLQTVVKKKVHMDFISADSQEGINTWECKINKVLQLLNDWS